MKRFYLTSIYLFLYAPIAILVIYSFNNASFTNSVWQGFTWDWYHTLFNDSQIITNTLHSLTISTVAATLTAILGGLITTVFSFYRFAGRKLMKNSLLIYVVLPDIVIGTSLLMIFHVLHWSLGFWTLLIGHLMLCLPFVVITLDARMHDLDPFLFEAAKDLGASDTTIIRQILLPLMLPALLAAWLLSFTLSFDDVIISFFLTGPDYQVLSLYVYSMVKLGISPEINAICAVIFGVSLVLVTTAYGLLKRQ